MRSRKIHAIISYAAFLAIAAGYGVVTGQAVDEWRVAFWSIIGVGSYIVLSQLFGFDPHRTRIADYAPALIQYVDRWELRLGQATLSMLGCLAVLAKFVDQDHFVTAVVSGTLAAWTYFALRLYLGGYSREKRIADRG
jgi:predicted MFS family arabinose efflux permease